MDRSQSEQGLLEAPSYTSLAAVSGASVISESSIAAPISAAGHAGTAVIHMVAEPLTQQQPPPNIALMQLQANCFRNNYFFAIHCQFFNFHTT